MLAPRTLAQHPGEVAVPLLLFLAFLLVPLLELAVIIQVGEVIGTWWTILLLVADSIVGAVIVKREGAKAWRDFRLALSERRWPGNEVVNGALILFGGALLLTPGFVTDAVGLLCVLPPSRMLIARTLRTRISPLPLRVVDLGAERMTSTRRQNPPPPGQAQQPDTLDVEVVSVERDDPPTPPEVT